MEIKTKAKQGRSVDSRKTKTTKECFAFVLDAHTGTYQKASRTFLSAHSSVREYYFKECNAMCRRDIVFGCTSST
jgi:hypothetical protein